jgi:hypothetical protein
LSERDRYVLDLVTPGLEDALRAAAGASAPHTALGAASPARTAVLLPDR